MSLFKVEKVINGNTIVINPNWSFVGEQGNEVIVRGYSPMFSHKISKNWNSDDENKLADQMAKSRLEFLLLDKFVDLRIASNETGDCINNENKLKCRVYFNSIDVSKYFPDFN